MGDYNFEYFLFDLVLTISAYMMIPTIYKLFTKKEIISKKANKISLINSIVIALLFIILTEALGGDGSTAGGAAFLYFFINKKILEIKTPSKMPTIVLSCICIVDFVCGLFYAFVIFWPISLIALISIIVKIIIGKNNFESTQNKVAIIARKKDGRLQFVCSNCKKIVNENDWFCTNCGEQFEEMDENYIQETTKERNKEGKKVNEIIEEKVVVDNKVRYCKLCGGKLNNEKKCTKCGKQYFYVKNKSILAIVPLSIFLIISIVININLYNEKSFLIDENWDLITENNRLETENEEINNNLFSVIGTNGVYYTQEKLEFFDENIVFVLKGYGNKYYTYDCVQQITDGEYTYWAYNKEAAIANGYKKGTC